MAGELKSRTPNTSKGLREPSPVTFGLRLPAQGVQITLCGISKKVAGRSNTAIFPRFKGQWMQAQCMSVDVCYSYLLTLRSPKYRLLLLGVHLASSGKCLQVGHVTDPCESHGRDSAGDMAPTTTVKVTWAQLAPHGGSRPGSFPSLQWADSRLPMDPPLTTQTHVASPGNLQKPKDTSGIAH